MVNKEQATEKPFGARAWCMACGQQIPPEGTEFFWAETVPKDGRQETAGRPVPICAPCGRRLTQPPETVERATVEAEAEEYAIIA